MIFDALTGLIVAHQRGEETPPHRPQPPTHLCGQTWKFVCCCGYTWKLAGENVADAVWRAGEWRGPRRECLNCHEWGEGHRVIER